MAAWAIRLFPSMKGVIQRQAEAEGRRLVDYSRVEIHAIERRPRLGKGGLKSAEVAKARRASACRDNSRVQAHDLPHRQVAHHASRR